MRLGIERWIAEALPEDKAARIVALNDEGRKVLMVGDGLNDAAAAVHQWRGFFDRVLLERRASLELGYWAGPLDNRFRVSQAGTLNQLEVAAAPKPYQVIPYALGVIDQEGNADGKAGIDGRYELTTTTTAFGTFNPDFALIEADRERVNLTRFEVSLPEKRQFFIDGDAHRGPFPPA